MWMNVGGPLSFLLSMKWFLSWTLLRTSFFWNLTLVDSFLCDFFSRFISLESLCMNFFLWDFFCASSCSGALSNNSLLAAIFVPARANNCCSLLIPNLLSRAPPLITLLHGNLFRVHSFSCTLPKLSLWLHFHSLEFIYYVLVGLQLYLITI